MTFFKNEEGAAVSITVMQVTESIYGVPMTGKLWQQHADGFCQKRNKKERHAAQKRPILEKKKLPANANEGLCKGEPACPTSVAVRTTPSWT